MRVLVTGSSGQVGSFVVDAYRAAGAAVAGVDLRPSAWTAHVADVRAFALAERPDVVVHCAAQVSVPRSMEDPRGDAAHNVDGTLAVLDLARRADASRVVLISSAAVYGDPATVPVREDFPVAPLSPYGLSKVVGEQYGRLYASLYGLPIAILRPFNIFSRRQDPANPYSGVISKFADALRAGAPLRIFGSGEQSRDFVHAADVVRAIQLVAAHPGAVGGTFNVGTGRATTVAALARTMADLAGGKSTIERQPPRAGDILHSVADVSRLRALGFAPRTSLERDLVEMLEPRKD